MAPNTIVAVRTPPYKTRRLDDPTRNKSWRLSKLHRDTLIQNNSRRLNLLKSCPGNPQSICVTFMNSKRYFLCLIVALERCIDSTRHIFAR